MNEIYVITETELAEKGLNLNDYALEGALIPAIINIALDICISRVCYLGDNINGENDLEERLGENENKIKAFKKLQYRVIHNLIFMGETDPMDSYTDIIISHELNIGKINGWQKGIYHKQS